MTLSDTRIVIYPPNWKELARACKDKANWQCESCGVKHGDIRTNLKGKLYAVVLTCHHPDGDTANPEARLVALCAACHLRDDAEMHAKHAQETINRKKREATLAAGQLPLLPEDQERIAQQKHDMKNYWTTERKANP